jgi:hypothetical protein
MALTSLVRKAPLPEDYYRKSTKLMFGIVQATEAVW